MPKKNSKSARQEDEHERKPQQITLGCFLKEGKPRGKRQDERDGKEQLKIQQGFASSSSAECLHSDNCDVPTAVAIQPNGEQTTKDECDKVSAAVWATECKEEGFKVMRTKKGGYPIYLEKRAKGKKVTVVRQVTGDSKLLLQTLKTKFGTGGLIKPCEVEIQGDFEEKLMKYFKDNAQFLVQYKSNT